MATTTERMRNSARNTILVVLDADDPATTLRAVMADSASMDATFHLLVIFPTAEYEARRQARLAADVTAPYTIDHLTEDARGIAQRVGRAYLDTDDGEFEAMGAVGRARDCVAEAVRTHDYSRVYVAERPRPVWQRLLGATDLSTDLVRGLPDVVTVVSVTDALASVPEQSEVEADFGPEMAPTPRSSHR